ncbi:hypothetical protein AZE42_13226 [Rhizopogon vesiculosus]|uniref:Uncharacterized protein n=1 Tax=Rhizopogon vesiculosus TaxID=180088 RepID=A0A1J8QFG9_9AGAM|nr:hypothetical protein AZE42_13226 [Rhizopogon vesiculosus]
MPKNLISLVLGSLLAKLYVNSYFALLNARYYVQPNHSDIVGKLQESQKNAIKRPYDHDRDIHPARPNQVVTKPIAVTMEIHSSSSV